MPAAIKLDPSALCKAAFDKPREPRSEAYKDGVFAALNYRIAGVRIRCPYSIGSAYSDAFLSGTDEGHSIFRRVTETPLES